MKMLLACRALDQMAGGVEKQAVNLVNEMAQRGHDVHLFSWDEESAHSFYNISPEVTWHKLNMGCPKHAVGWRMRLKRAASIRKLFWNVRPDIVVAFQHGIFLSLKIYCLGLGIPFIASERSAISRLDHTKAGRRKDLILQSFRMARCITVQFESYIQDYPQYLRKNIRVIPNPVVVQEKVSDPSGANAELKILLSIGRLSYQKNYNVLVRAFANIYINYPDWHLRIVGEGELRSDLEKLCKEIGLPEDAVSFPGVTNNVGEEYLKAHLFCLSSRWEGFPNTMAEAASYGLPLVGFEGCSGVRDLVQDGCNGALAHGNGDVDALEQALSPLMAGDVLRADMGQCAVENIARYVPHKIYDLWEETLLQAAGMK